jgi:hypothetical protein
VLLAAFVLPAYFIFMIFKFLRLEFKADGFRLGLVKQFQKQIKSLLELIRLASLYKYLILSALIMYFLFVASPMELSQINRDAAATNIKHKASDLSVFCKSSNYSCQFFLEGMKLQLQKANTEIQSRIEQEASWFQLKYYVVGSILLGFIINTYYKSGRQKTDFSIFLQASSSAITSFILSLAIIVAVSIDMQIRAGRIVINQLGSWIHHYAEPILLGEAKGYNYGLGWEFFLRQDGGYHKDIVYAMTFWPNIYYLSIALYVLYLIVSQKAFTKKRNREIVLSGFSLLHITLLIATLSNHIVPFIFEVKLVPLASKWILTDSVNPSKLVPVYISFWFVLLLVAYRFISKRPTLPERLIHSLTEDCTAERE